MPNTGLEWIRYLLASPDDALVKRGLQEVCALLESGQTWPASSLAELKRRLSQLLGSPATLVRRWTYKTIALLRDRQFVPALVGRIRAAEQDPENVTWAIAAVAAIQRTRQSAASPLVALSNESVQLALGFFVPAERPKTQRDFRSLVNEKDPLALRWLSLIFGASRGRIGGKLGRSAVQSMNSSDDPDVAEYSLWALTEGGTTSFADVRLDPTHLNDYPPNVRRWFFRLLLKDRDALDCNFALIERAIAEEQDVAAREGIAVGLRGHELDETSSELIVDWYNRESAPIVRAQLTRAFIVQTENPVFVEAREAERREPRDEMSEILLPAVRRRGIVMLGELGGKERRQAMLIPTIRTETQNHTYVVAMDTVGFSAEEDPVQLQVFRDLLDSIRNVDARSLAVLLTGDGVILGLQGEPTAAVRLAIEIYKIWSKTKAKGIRVGLNSGPAYWLTMSDGTTQLIGHAVNWATRVMSVLPGPGISIGKQYYDVAVRPRQSDFGDVEFIPVDGRTTKHGESVPALDVKLRS